MVPLPRAAAAVVVVPSGVDGRPSPFCEDDNAAEEAGGGADEGRAGTEKAGFGEVCAVIDGSGAS